MDVLSQVNIVTILMIAIFTIPILVGVILPLTGERIRRSFASLLGSVIFLTCFVLSIYLTKVILSGGDNFVLTGLYQVFPSFREAVEGGEIWVYAVFITVLLLLLEGFMQLLAWPIRRFALEPMSDRMASAVQSKNGFIRRVIGGLWKLPRSLWLVLVFCVALNLYTGLFNSSIITQHADNSVPYRLVQENVIQPLMNSSAVKNIRVILNDSFKTAENALYDATGKRLVRYFNGVTLDEAVQSNAEIDAKAEKIVGAETDAKRKAYLIYLWICENITYDNAKAAVITKDASGVSSGAIVAFNTRSGVCFDFACLYVAMCRAARVKVRFITGQGYTGTEWGDHAWNQAYDPKEKTWINVDTTFGSSGVNYFGRAAFYLDHRDGVVQGEW